MYLRIKIDEKSQANEKGYLFAFENENKSSESAPDFKSSGVSVWVNDQQPKEEQAPQPEQQTVKPTFEAQREVFKPRVLGARTR